MSQRIDKISSIDPLYKASQFIDDGQSGHQFLIEGSAELFGN